MVGYLPSLLIPAVIIVSLSGVFSQVEPSVNISEVIPPGGPSINVTVDQCEVKEKDCSFYDRCVEKKEVCGATGYALGTGLKYCQKFTENIDKFSAVGQPWVWSKMVCIQNALVPISKGESKTDCEQIKKTAFNSHASCYTTPEKSLCTLPPQDWIEMFKIIVDALKDLETWKNIAEVGKNCATHYFETFVGKMKVAFSPKKGEIPTA